MILKKLLPLKFSALILLGLAACTQKPAETGADTSRAPEAAQNLSQPNTQAVATVVPEGEQTSFRGDIGGKYKIQMRLRRNGAELSGTYFYENKATDITLKGAIDKQGNFTLQEFDQTGRQTGLFKGRWKEAAEDETGASLEGHWSKPDGSGALTFSLDEFPVELVAGSLVASENLKEENKRQKYTIDVEYPQVKGSTDAHVANFNRHVKELMLRKVSEFKKEMAEQEQLPGASGMGSSLDVGYTVGIANERLITVGFSIGSYYSGAAHPNSYTEVVNYDLKAARPLKLSDLFKPGAQYLRAISDYCIKDLKKQNKKHGADAPLTDESIEEGASPDPKNYENWLITKKGLAVTFDAYQVGPYAAGPQFVLIPYAALKEIILPGGPVAPFVR